MIAAVKTQNQALLRGQTSSACDQRMAESHAVMGFLRLSVSRTVGIQDNGKIEAVCLSDSFYMETADIIEPL